MVATHAKRPSEQVAWYQADLALDLFPFLTASAPFFSGPNALKLTAEIGTIAATSCPCRVNTVASSLYSARETISLISLRAPVTGIRSYIWVSLYKMYIMFKIYKLYILYIS
jgi:hypothetical protein